MLDEIAIEKHTGTDPRSSGISLVVVVSLVTGLVAGLIGGYAGGRYGSQIAGQLPTSLSEGQPATMYVASSTSEEAATISVVKRSSDSVVSIVIKKDLAKIFSANPRSPFDSFFGQNIDLQAPQGMQQIGGGSGFIISSDGLILTNRHVVADAEAEYSVITTDGKEHEAKVLALDQVNDIAILKMDGKNLKPLDLGDSSGIQIGQTVIAIGNTLGEYHNTVTRGVISGINRVVQAGDGNGSVEVIQEAIQTDAAINPGNSGGPLLDLSGKVIGINTAVNQEGQSIGFAIPIDVARRSVESVKKYGRIIRPWIGVRYAIVDAEIKKANNLSVDYGAIVIGSASQKQLAVIPGSPADKAGIVEGDVILQINDTRLDEGRSLASEISKYTPGDDVTLKVLSKGKQKDVRIHLEEYKKQ